MKVEVLVENGLLCSEDAPPVPGKVGCRDGKIVFIGGPDAEVSADRTVDAGGRLVMPGMIDPHVHIGHGARHADEFWSEGRSAIVGGVTTMLTFFRKFPFDYSVSVPELIGDGESNSPVDFGVHLPLYSEANLDEIDTYRQMGVGGFKFFPGIAGEDAAKMTDLPHTGPMLSVDDSFVLDGMGRIARTGDSLTLYHAENPSLNHAAADRVKASGRSDLAAWCDSRPDAGEAHSVRDGLWWQRMTGGRLYIVHLSSQVALEEVIEERKRGIQGEVYVETCPQFLVLTRDSDIGTIGKMSPPFRTQADSDALWAAIADGDVDTIGSDHGAFLRAEKADAWAGRSGFPGMATILPILVTYGLNKARLSAQDICRVFSSNPARIFGLHPQKGSLAVGSDADIIVVDTEQEREVKPEDLFSRSDFSVFEGLQLSGWPTHVLSRGRVVLDNGTMSAQRGHGEFLDTRGGGW